MAVLLGGVLLEGLAAVAGIGYGGAQSLAVHKLPGGTRMIDAMGPDDADITWHGYLAGMGAVDTARLLDAMRSAGAALPLSWDAVTYSVVIAHLEFSYRNSKWISYSIRCAVITAAEVVGAVSPSVLPLIVADLTQASAWCNVAPALVAVQSQSALAQGTPNNARAAAAAATARMLAVTGIASAEAMLAASAVPNPVQAAGSLAGLTCAVAAAGTLAGLAAAQGYIGRAATNLNNAGT
jgi:hypothetical protein